LIEGYLCFNVCELLERVEFWFTATDVIEHCSTRLAPTPAERWQSMLDRWPNVTDAQQKKDSMLARHLLPSLRE